MASSGERVSSLFSDNWGVEEGKIPRPLLSPSSLPVPGKFTVVTFDIEGTGLLREGAEIVQLAAVYSDAGKRLNRFNKYVLPKGEFVDRASEVTGITIREGQMFKNDVAVETVDMEKMLRMFVEWITATPGMPYLHTKPTWALLKKTVVYLRLEIYD